MGKEDKFGPMEGFTMDFGMKTRCMDKASLCMRTKTFTKENLIMTRLTVLVNTFRSLEKYMKAIGVKINPTEKANRPLRMGPFMMEISPMGPKMGKVLIYGLMALVIRGLGWLMNSMAMVSILGQMAESTQVNGKTISCMARALSFMKMVEPTVVSTKTTKNTETVFINGSMAKYTTEGGCMANKMELPNLRILLDRLDMVFGRMVRELPGRIQVDNLKTLVMIKLPHHKRCDIFNLTGR